MTISKGNRAAFDNSQHWWLCVRLDYFGDATRMCHLTLTRVVAWLLATEAATIRAPAMLGLLQWSNVWIVHGTKSYTM